MLANKLVYQIFLNLVITVGVLHANPQKQTVMLYDFSFGFGSHGFELGQYLNSLGLQVHQIEVSPDSKMGFKTGSSTLVKSQWDREDKDKLTDHEPTPPNASQDPSQQGPPNNVLKHHPKKSESSAKRVVMVFPFGVKSKTCNFQIPVDAVAFVSLGVGVENPFVHNRVAQICPHQLSRGILVGEDYLKKKSDKEPKLTGDILENKAEKRPVVRVRLSPSSSSSGSAGNTNKVRGSSMAAVVVAAAAACSEIFARKLQDRISSKEFSKSIIYTQEELEMFCRH